MKLTEETGNVAEFMNASDQPVRIKPTTDVPRKEIALRLKLALEELTELADATGLGESFRKIAVYILAGDLVEGKAKDFPQGEANPVEILDALADIQYINRGTAHTFGLGEALYPAEIEVHTSNMTKVEPDGKVRKNEAGKVVKGPNYREPNLQVIVDKYLNK
jgi:predicted HAD superfamily Cof-like phosphohydrolase